MSQPQPNRFDLEITEQGSKISSALDTLRSPQYLMRARVCVSSRLPRFLARQRRTEIQILFADWIQRRIAELFAMAPEDRKTMLTVSVYPLQIIQLAEELPEINAR